MHAHRNAAAKYAQDSHPFGWQLCRSATNASNPKLPLTFVSSLPAVVRLLLLLPVGARHADWCAARAQSYAVQWEPFSAIQHEVSASYAVSLYASLNRDISKEQSKQLESINFTMQTHPLKISYLKKHVTKIDQKETSAPTPSNQICICIYFCHTSGRNSAPYFRGGCECWWLTHRMRLCSVFRVAWHLVRRESTQRQYTVFVGP